MIHSNIRSATFFASSLIPPLQRFNVTERYYSKVLENTVRKCPGAKIINAPLPFLFYRLSLLYVRPHHMILCHPALHISIAPPSKPCARGCRFLWTRKCRRASLMR